MNRCEGAATPAGRHRRAGASVNTILAILATAVAATACASGATAMSPFLFFRQVERVGLLCAVDAEPQRAGALAETTLCGLAETALTALLGPDGPPVAVLGRNDERIADPAMLLVLVHAGLQPRDAAGHGTVLALSAALQRVRTDVGTPPFFTAVPQAVVAPDGVPGAGPLDGPPLDTGAVRDALRRLLAGVARPLLANRPAAKP